MRLSQASHAAMILAVVLLSWTASPWGKMPIASNSIREPLIATVLVLSISSTEPKNRQWTLLTRFNIEKVLDTLGFTHREIDLDKQTLTRSDLVWDNGTRKYRVVFFADMVLREYLSATDIALLVNAAVGARMNVIVAQPLIDRALPYTGLSAIGPMLQWNQTVVVGSSRSNFRVLYDEPYGTYRDAQYGIDGLYIFKYSPTGASVRIWISNGTSDFPVLTAYGYQTIQVYAISVFLNIVTLDSTSDHFVATIACTTAFTEAAGDLPGNENLFASIIVDDFSLLESQHAEFVQYLEALEETGAAGDIAFVGNTVSEPASLYSASVSLARDGSRYLEILNHGIQHTQGEFAGAIGEVVSNVAVALDDMEQLRRLTGLSYAPLVVVPAEVYGKFTFRGFEEAGLLGATYSKRFSEGIEHYEPPALGDAFSNLPLIGRTLVGNLSNTDARTPLFNTRLILAERLFRCPLLVFAHPQDFAVGNRWLVSIIHYSQQLGYDWVKTSELFWRFRKWVFDSGGGESRIVVANSVFPELSADGKPLYYDLDSLQKPTVLVHSETSTFALIAANATVLNSRVDASSATLTVRNIVTVPATIRLYSPCSPSSVGGARSWSYNDEVLQIQVMDPTTHASQSTVTITCSIQGTTTTRSETASPTISTEWMLPALAGSIALAIAAVVLLRRRRIV